MQPTTILLFAASALAATTSPMSQCATEFNKCRQSASALTLLSSCTINLAACTASGAMTMVDESPSKATMPEDIKKAYRKCQKEYNECRTEPGANLSTCASEAVECFEEVKEEAQELKAEQGEVVVQNKPGKEGLSINL